MRPKSRLVYIDNLRLALIVLIIMMHCAITYSGIGGWAYYDPAQPSDIAIAFFALFQAYVQAVSLGLLFLIAGYFAYFSLRKKGVRSFIRDRAIRLGYPALFYMLILNPLTGLLVMRDLQVPLAELARQYSEYYLRFHFIGGSGPLWFAVALLFFSIVYALASRIFAERIAVTPQRPFPSVAQILLIIVLIGVLTFLVRLVQPIGTDILNMQLCYFVQYVVMFIIGIVSAKNDWLDQVDRSNSRRWLAIGLIAGTLLFFIALIGGGALDEGLDSFFGGFTWQSLFFSTWEPFVGVTLTIGLIGLFKTRFNSQSDLLKSISDNSFAIFVFHAPFIIGLALLLAPLTLPSMLKFLLLSASSIPLIYLFTNYVVRRIPVFGDLFFT